MKRIVGLILILSLLAAPALADGGDAQGLYTPLETSQQEEMQSTARLILDSIVTEDMSEAEKALVIHDWIVLNCRYNLTQYQDMAYGAIVKREVICRGYARGYAYLAGMAGIETQYTFSAALLHAWTLSRVDGSYYVIDPTWDDDHYERIGFVNHRHCMVSDATAREQTHYGADIGITAEGGIYENAPWRQAVTRVVFQGDYLYYISRDLELICCNRQSGECQTLYRFEQSWPGFYEDYADIPAPATGLVLMRGRLWFNTPLAVISVNTEGGDVRQEMSVDGSEGYICGIDVREGRLVYSLSDSRKNDKYQLCDTGISGWDAWGCEPSEAGPWTELLARASALAG